MRSFLLILLKNHLAFTEILLCADVPLVNPLLTFISTGSSPSVTSTEGPFVLLILHSVLPPNKKQFSRPLSFLQPHCLLPLPNSLHQMILFCISDLSPTPLSPLPLGTFLAAQWLRLDDTNAGGAGLVLGGRAKIPHATGRGQKMKKEIRCCHYHHHQ